MLSAYERDQIIDYILKGNEMIRRHAEERQSIIQKIVEFLEESETPHEELVRLAISEAVTIQDHIEGLNLKISGATPDEASDYQRLKHLNQVIPLLDQKEKQKEVLVDAIMQQDANLVARDELIDILHEYIDIEEVQSHRILSELSEVQNQVELAQKKLDTYERLSKHDPRFNALKILGLHQEGMSATQLTYMLDTTRYEANKIINQLLEMGIIERVGNGELLKVTDSFESQFVLNISV